MEPITHLNTLIERYPVLRPIEGQIKAAYHVLQDCYENGGKLLVAGNGGSCADAEHIVGELMKGFVKRRPVSEGEREALSRQGSRISKETGIEENLGEELAC